MHAGPPGVHRLDPVGPARRPIGAVDVPRRAGRERGVDREGAGEGRRGRIWR